MTIEELKQLRKYGVFRRIDIQFADLLRELTTVQDVNFYLACLLASAAAADGHVCIDLKKMAAGKFPTYPPYVLQQAERDEVELPFFELPSLPQWSSILLQENLQNYVGAGGYKPLILDEQSRLYLHQQWCTEQMVAQHLKALASGPDQDLLDSVALRTRLDALFGSAQNGVLNWQKLAAVACLKSRLLILTGGPGTGKTYTVARIAALLLEQAGDRVLRLLLAAPTGKAAARMSEAISEAKADSVNFPCSPEIRAKIPDQAATMHRLLGARRYSPHFRHHAGNPLAADVVIIDEASMVDVSLMASFLHALPAHARLILLGDKDQLASVAPGAVLADICQAADVERYSAEFADVYRRCSGETLAPERAGSEAPLADCAVHLTVSRRFHAASPIGRLSHAVNSADDSAAADQAWALLLQFSNAENSNITWRPLPARLRLSGGITADLKDVINTGYVDFVRTETAKEAIEAFNNFQILCATREGHCGMRNLNALTEQILSATASSPDDAARLVLDSNFYNRRAVMVQQNDYNVGLFNGDVGIVLQDAGGGRHVWFKTAEGHLRSVRPNLLPSHETAFAMTVHKSQGSEFDHVLLILPEHDSPLLTRELIYTAITRSRRKIDICCSEAIFKAAVQRRAERASGLKDRLVQQ